MIILICQKQASETGAKFSGVRKEASETGAKSSGMHKQASETGANHSGVLKQASDTGAKSSGVRKEASERLNLNNTVQAKRSAVTDNQHTARVSERRDLAYVPIADNPNLQDSQDLCPQGKDYNIMYRGVPRKLSHQTAPDKMSVGQKPYEIFNKYLPSSTGVEGGKNLVRIWVEFDKKMVLFFSRLKMAIFWPFLGFFRTFCKASAPDILSGF